MARGRVLTAHAYCRRQSHAKRCDSSKWEARRVLTGIAEEPGSDGAGVACPLMRPHAGKERQEPRGQGLVLKAAAGRLSYAAAVRGLVDNPGSADISQSKLGDFRQPDLDEFLRPVFDENRRPEAADVTGQSPNAVRPPGSDDLTSHGIDGSVRPETNMNPPGGVGTCDRSGSGAVGSGLLQDRRAVLIRTATWTWVAKLKAGGDKAPPP